MSAAAYSRRPAIAQAIDRSTPELDVGRLRRQPSTGFTRRTRSPSGRRRRPNRMTAPERCERALSTQRRPWRFSQRATGPPWNLTFADAAKQVRERESGHLQVAIIDMGNVPAERLHPKAAYSPCRP